MTLSNSLPFRYSRELANRTDEIIETNSSPDKSAVFKGDGYFWPSEIKKNDTSDNSVISNSHTPADHSSLKNINSQIVFDRKPKILEQSQPKFSDQKSGFDFVGKNRSCSGLNYSFKSHGKSRLTREDRRKQS
jgi:hypothetical protein